MGIVTDPDPVAHPSTDAGPVDVCLRRSSAVRGASRARRAGCEDLGARSRALAVGRSTGRRRAQAETLDLLGHAVDATGEEDPAGYRQEAAEIFRTLGIPAGRARGPR